MAEQPYDPQARKERYERTKQLKGRSKGASNASSKPTHSSISSQKPNPRAQASQDRVVRVRDKLNTLKHEQSKVQAELSIRRKTVRNEKKENSDGKSTSNSSSGVADLSTQELRARLIKIRGAITVARRLLSNASLEHGQLAHSAIVSEPDVNERFARFRSAERGPST